MTLIKHMIQNLLLALAVGAVAFATSLYAQTAQQSEAQPPGAEQGQTPTQTDSDTSSEPDTEQAQSPPLPDIDTQPIQPGARSNGRFIPSEQISQDLGVSFPVDI